MGAKATAIRLEGATAIMERANLSIAPAFFMPEENIIIRHIRQTKRIVSALKMSLRIVCATVERLSPRQKAIAKPPKMAAKPSCIFRDVRNTTRTKIIKICRMAGI